VMMKKSSENGKLPVKLINPLATFVFDLVHRSIVSTCSGIGTKS